MIADGNAHLLSLTLSAGQRADCTQLEATLDAICVPRRRGRSRKRPGSLIADKAYDSRRCRQLLRRRGIRPVIPLRKPRKTQRRPTRGRPIRWDRERYKRRNVVERLIGGLKQFRRIATRYEKRAWNYWAMVLLGAAQVWLRYLSDTP